MCQILYVTEELAFLKELAFSKKTNNGKKSKYCQFLFLSYVFNSFNPNGKNKVPLPFLKLNKKIKNISTSISVVFPTLWPTLSPNFDNSWNGSFAL